MNNEVTVNIIKYPQEEDWILARNNALATQRKSNDNPVPSKLKTKFLVSEHSPIRTLMFEWEWINLPYWVGVHIVRHHEGIIHFVSSQRNDLQNKYDRRKAPQDSPVNHRCFANAQAILNISRARLCLNASPETRKAWMMVLEALEPYAPELVALCVPPCIYRNGFCPEVFKPCGYNHTAKFNQKLSEYSKIIGFSEGGDQKE